MESINADDEKDINFNITSNPNVQIDLGDDSPNTAHLGKYVERSLGSKMTKKGT